MSNEQIRFTVDAPTGRLANVQASALAEMIQDLGIGAQVERAKADASTLDAGTIVSVVLNSTAIASLAIGLSGWLKKKAAKESTLKLGELELANLPPDAMERMLREYLKRQGTTTKG